MLILFHVEQHPLNSILAAGDWIDRIFGGPYLAIVFALVCLCLLVIALVSLVIILKTIKGSWEFFHWLHLTRGKSLPCTHCGYDLRHKPERCPECGQRVWFRNRRKTAPPIPPPSDPGVIALPSHGLPSPPDTANNDWARPADR